jgi:hypothetical protein
MMQFIGALADLTDPVHIVQAPAPLRFVGHDRKGRTIDRITMHEPAVATLQSTIKTLQAKNLSVHYTIDRDGSVMQHCPIERYCAHAGIPGKVTGHNTRSIGLEYINRYYGHRVGQVKGLKLYEGAYEPILISGIWVDRAWNAKQKRFANPDRLYIMPTHAQLEAGWKLVRHLLLNEGLAGAVKEFSGISRTLTGKEVYNWTPVRGHDSPGVKAHAQWAHADGRTPLFYAVLRSRGVPSDQAWGMTLEAAASMKKQTTLPT